MKTKTQQKKAQVISLPNKPSLKMVESHEHYRLFDMLTYMRPFDSIADNEFCKEFIEPYDPVKDEFGNYHLVVGDNPKTMFTAHTDTVHMQSGYQAPVYFADDDFITAPLTSNCLGADDTTGIYIMLSMIDKGVPGYYLFTRGEEYGCLGSKWIVDNTPEIFEGIKVAIAFDRKGYEDIITEQSTGKCASVDCACQMAEMLNKYDLDMKASPHGVYTDTAHFNELVPECFNLSVGYFSQHTSDERQDLKFLSKFMKACLEVNWESLEPVRKTTDLGDYGFSWDKEFDDGTVLERLTEFTRNNPEVVASYLVDYAGFDDNDVDAIVSMKDEIQDGLFFKESFERLDVI